MKTNFDITKILYSIKHINDLYYNLSTKAADECGITKPEADILAFLYNNPACDTAKDIAKLLDKELIKIYIDKNDRRCQHLKLTEKSKPLVIKLQKMQIEFINKITDGIPKEDIEKYLEVMVGFANNALK